jgi:hypothetical protein
MVDFAKNTTSLEYVKLNMAEVTDNTQSMGRQTIQALT